MLFRSRNEESGSKEAAARWLLERPSGVLPLGLPRIRPPGRPRRLRWFPRLLPPPGRYSLPLNSLDLYSYPLYFFVFLSLGSRPLLNFLRRRRSKFFSSSTPFRCPAPPRRRPLPSFPHGLPGLRAYAKRDASEAMCPAKEVTNVFKLVKGESSENSPVFSASRGEAKRQAELYKPSLTSFWQSKSYRRR